MVAVRDPASRDGSGRRRDSQRRVHRVDRAGPRPTANGRYGTTRRTGYGSSSTWPSRHCPATNDPTTAVGCLDDRRCAAFGQPAPAAGLRIQQRVAPALARRRATSAYGRSGLDHYCIARAALLVPAGARGAEPVDITTHAVSPYRARPGLPALSSSSEASAAASARRRWEACRRAASISAVRTAVETGVPSLVRI